MIELHTGVPGSGKTASVVDFLMTFAEKNPGRPIFTHGIPELRVSTLVLPVFSPSLGEKGGFTSALEVDWSSIPTGALVVVDEAQQVFPRRSSGSRVPGYVSFLNTHRHQGIDIVLITQHPRLVDAAATALVGKHCHYRKIFGGARHVVYEWDACSPTLSNLKTATTRVRSIPRRAFEAYRSATLHTKSTFRLPLWAWLVPAGLVGLTIIVAPRLVDLGGKIGGGQGVVRLAASSPVALSAPASAVAAVASAPTIAVAAASSPASAPASEAMAAAPASPPVTVGCISRGKRCVCYTDSGQQVHVDSHQCIVGARGFDGPVKLALAASPVVAGAIPERRGAAEVVTAGGDEAAAPIDWSQPPMTSPRRVFSER